MSIYVIRIDDARGRVHELASLDPLDEGRAVRDARRVASLLSVVGDPGRWSGGKVCVVEAVGNRLVAAVRIRVRTRNPVET